MMLTSQGKKRSGKLRFDHTGEGKRGALSSNRPRYPGLKAAPSLPKPCNQKGGAVTEFLTCLILIAIITCVFFVIVPNFATTEARELCESQGLKYESGWPGKVNCSRIENGYIIHKSFEKIENEWYEVKGGE